MGGKKIYKREMPVIYRQVLVQSLSHFSGVTLWFAIDYYMPKCDFVDNAFQWMAHSGLAGSAADARDELKRSHSKPTPPGVGCRLTLGEIPIVIQSCGEMLLRLLPENRRKYKATSNGES